MNKKYFLYTAIVSGLCCKSLAFEGSGLPPMPTSTAHPAFSTMPSQQPIPYPSTPFSMMLVPLAALSHFSPLPYPSTPLAPSPTTLNGSNPLSFLAEVATNSEAASMARNRVLPQSESVFSSSQHKPFRTLLGGQEVRFTPVKRDEGKKGLQCGHCNRIFGNRAGAQSHITALRKDFEKAGHYLPRKAIAYGNDPHSRKAIMWRPVSKDLQSGSTCGHCNKVFITREDADRHLSGILQSRAATTATTAAAAAAAALPVTTAKYPIIAPSNGISSENCARFHSPARLFTGATPVHSSTETTCILDGCGQIIASSHFGRHIRYCSRKTPKEREERARKLAAERRRDARHAEKEIGPRNCKDSRQRFNEAHGDGTESAAAAQVSDKEQNAIAPGAQNEMEQ